MPLLNEHDLIAAGYPAGPRLQELLKKSAALEARGITDPAYALKLLKREAAPPPKQGLREEPAPLALAIDTGTAEEISNLAAVKRQILDLLRAPVVEAGALMPDACPAGPGIATMPVGGVIAVKNAIIPSAHSSDICCSMFATFYPENLPVSQELDALASVTRFGPGPRPRAGQIDDPVVHETVWTNPFLSGLRDRAIGHLADQGDGNHFAFIGTIDVDAGTVAALREAGHCEIAEPLAGQGRCRVLVTHHGSRGLGAHVFKRGQNAALKHVAKHASGIPESAAWLDADSCEGRAYWDALQYVARWTRANHEAIHRRFLDAIDSRKIASLGNEHNFVWKRGDLYLHGKGATPAWNDEQGRPLPGLIPLNMAEPILLVLGSDRADFLSFAPHGAGRNLSRTALRRQFKHPQEREAAINRSTRGLDIRWFCGKPDLGETPVAYKNAGRIREQIEHFGLARIIGEISPLGCIMAGEVPSWRDREEELTPKERRQIEHRAQRRKVRQDLHDASDWNEP